MEELIKELQAKSDSELARASERAKYDPFTDSPWWNRERGIDMLAYAGAVRAEMRRRKLE